MSVFTDDLKAAIEAGMDADRQWDPETCDYTLGREDLEGTFTPDPLAWHRDCCGCSNIDVDRLVALVQATIATYAYLPR